MDVITDFNENNGGLLKELNHEDQGWITERLQSEIQNIISVATEEK